MEGWGESKGKILRNMSLNYLLVHPGIYLFLLPFMRAGVLVGIAWAREMGKSLDPDCWDVGRERPLWARGK